MFGVVWILQNQDGGRRPHIVYENPVNEPIIRRCFYDALLTNYRDIDVRGLIRYRLQLAGQIFLLN